MERKNWILASLLLAGATDWVRAETTVAPPVARRIEHREVRHGQTVVDPYYWLREKTKPEVLEYLHAENAYTASVTANVQGFADALYEEMLARVKQTDLSVPVQRGSYFYYSRTEEGKQYPIQCRRQGSMDGPEETLLDINELARGHAFMALGAFSISDDQNLLAYSTDTTGYRQYRLSVKDLRTGEILPDTAERVTSIEWAADNKTLIYATEDEVTKRADQLWKHTLGAGESEKLYEEKDELFKLRSQRSRDKKFNFLQIESADASEAHYLTSDTPDGSFKVVLPREKGHRYRVEHREGLFYIRTNRSAKNFQVVTAPIAEPTPEHWKVLVPAQDDTLVQGFEAFKNFGVVHEKSKALSTFRILDFRTGQWNGVVFPEPIYSAFASANVEYGTDVYRYNYQSMVTPPSTFDYDMATRQATLLKQEDVLGGYDRGQYVSERLWATARDGTRVPISIVYKKGLKRDGSAPLFLYAYGSYGTGVPATFASQRVSLLDRGMLFAIAHVRGGDEMGESWREGGMLMNKKNTFHDFIDCAQFLVNEKWTSSQGLVIEGFSAGGLLVGAVVNMRPDLFRAAHAGVPFVNVMNTMMDASLPLTVGEYLVWGNPNERAAYDYMLSYSPYDNLESRAYPAMLVTASLNDSQVMVWEPAKYVARMRTVKTDDRPLLLKVNMAAGHGGSSGFYDRLKEQAFQYAWLLSQVGIEK